MARDRLPLDQHTLVDPTPMYHVLVSIRQTTRLNKSYDIVLSVVIVLTITKMSREKFEHNTAK